MTLQTHRLSLPLLAVAQAQKEVTHNEALAMIDALVQPVVVSVAPASVPGAPTPGQAWIVGTGATGLWSGQDDALAVWTAGGWRFAAAFAGMMVWSLADSMIFRRTASAWLQGALTGRTLTLDGAQVVGARGAAIASPSGGSTIDAEARTALAEALDRLRGHGLIST